MREVTWDAKTLMIPSSDSLNGTIVYKFLFQTIGT